jgi:hypothetical protein
VSPTPALPDFEGLEVVGCRIEVRNVAGGLNDAMDVNPVMLHSGDEFDVTYRCKVGPIRHDPVDKNEPSGPQWRVHIASASRAVITDKARAEKDFAAQAELLAQREQIKGQQKAGTSPPWLGYDDLTVDEVLERIDGFDSSDEDTVNTLESYEEANGGRSKILKAIVEWRTR